MCAIVVSELEGVPDDIDADGCVHVVFQVFVAMNADERVTVKCLCHNPMFTENTLQVDGDRPAAEIQITLVFFQLVYTVIQHVNGVIISVAFVRLLHRGPRHGSLLEK